MIETIISGTILFIAFLLLKTMPNAKEEKYDQDTQVSNEPPTLTAERGDYDHLFNETNF